MNVLVAELTETIQRNNTQLSLQRFLKLIHNSSRLNKANHDRDVVWIYLILISIDFCAP